MNEIFTKYSLETNQNLWAAIENALVRTKTKGLNFNSNIEEVYNQMNWPHQIDLDFDVDIYECALFADCTKMNKKSLEKN